MTSQTQSRESNGLQIEELLKKAYHRIIVRDPEGSFSSRVLEFDGCFAGGATPEEAAEAIEEVMALWLEAELEQGHKIPEPFGSREHSGRLNLRMPASLHERAALRAAVEGVSLNQLLVAAVAAHLGSSVTSSQVDPHLWSVEGALIEQLSALTGHSLGVGRRSFVGTFDDHWEDDTMEFSLLGAHTAIGQRPFVHR